MLLLDLDRRACLLQDRCPLVGLFFVEVLANHSRYRSSQGLYLFIIAGEAEVRESVGSREEAEVHESVGSREQAERGT